MAENSPIVTLIVNCTNNLSNAFMQMHEKFHNYRTYKTDWKQISQTKKKFWLENLLFFFGIPTLKSKYCFLMKNILVLI